MIRLVAIFILLTVASCVERKTPLVTSKPEKGLTVTEREVLYRENGLLKDHFFGYTPLIQAVCTGDVAKVQKALEGGADVNWKMEWGLTALMWAADQGHTPVVTVLIAHGADVNAQNEEGLTALMLAAREGRTETVKLLLKNKADPSRKDLTGKTAADWAKENIEKTLLK
jgi:ankyrin repeat protein